MSPEPVEVAWQLCDDEAMTRVVKSGTTAATPEWSHSVHVEVEVLRPDRWYWYQFRVGGEVSPKARTRTAPPADVLPERLRFAFASCQHYEAGHFTAYQRLAREDVDLVVHLGDYIYEGPGRDGFARRPAAHSRQLRGRVRPPKTATGITIAPAPRLIGGARAYFHPCHPL